MRRIVEVFDAMNMPFTEEVMEKFEVSNGQYLRWFMNSGMYGITDKQSEAINAWLVKEGHDGANTYVLLHFTW